MSETRDVWALAAKYDEMEEALERALYLADNLIGMVPREVWRDQGGDDGQGHYEGDYWAQNVADEIAQIREKFLVRPADSEEGAE